MIWRSIGADQVSRRVSAIEGVVQASASISRSWRPSGRARS